MPTDYPPPEPCKPVADFRYLTVPKFMMDAALETGASETQINAVMAALYRTTATECLAHRSVTWPRFGRWKLKHYTQKTWEADPWGNTITLPDAWFFNFTQYARWQR